MGEPNPSDSPEEKRQELFRLAMQGKWKEVISHCKTYPDLQDKPLTRAGDTTLHVAISAGNEDTVMQLLAVLKVYMTTCSKVFQYQKEETKGKEGGMNGILPKKNDDGSTPMVRKILEMQNESGSTPMHLAAALGMCRACGEMARLCPDLVTTMRNKNGETPLFTAVKHGKKEAFFALEHRLQEKRELTHCRRDKDGNNILHCAIFGEYFDLAYEIIYLYPQLVNYVNVKGESPLHYLANMPSCFRSGTRFGLFNQVIYFCIIIGPLKTKFDKYKCEKKDQLGAHASDNPNLPETWDTISQIYTFIKPVFATIIPKQIREKQTKNDEENPVSAGSQQESSEEEKQQLPFPKIYEVGFALFKIVKKILLVILGIGLRRTQTLEKIKRKHNHAYQLMNELVQSSQAWEYEKKDGMDPHISFGSHASPSKAPDAETSTDSLAPPKEPPPVDSSSSNDADASHTGVQRYIILKMLKKEKIIYGDIDEPKEDETNKPDKATPVLVAAKNGITEMVEKILDKFPVAMLDLDKDEKNIVLLAVEYRQSHIYSFMDKRKTMKDSIFGRVDKDGNSALHLAAKLSLQKKLPWSIRGAALQMQWEIKWYKYVMQSMDGELFATYNASGQTARELFTEAHKGLVDEAGKWLFNTSRSCSVVAALIAGVSFASTFNVPGGLNQNTGFPNFFDKVPFQIFALSSLVALFFSVTSLIMFLTILTSRYQEEDFERSLPAKMIFGFTSLITAIAAMLVSFCTGDFFVVEGKLKYTAFPMYAFMCLPVAFFASAQLPLYVDLVWATLVRMPERTQKMRTF